jgi:hypothetical protein
MTKLDQLSFCSVCINRQSSSKDGTICGLTSKPADFNDSCSNFRLDYLEKRNLIDKIKKEIDNTIQLDKKLLVYPSLRHLVNSKNSEPHLNNSKPNELIISEVRKRKIHFLIIGIILIILLAKEIYKNQLLNENSGLIFGSLIILVSIYCIYLYLKNGEILRVSKLGIIIKRKEFVPWNRIDYIHGQILPELYLVLKMHWGFGDDKKIEITHANMDIDDICRQLYTYIKTYKQN